MEKLSVKLCDDICLFNLDCMSCMIIKNHMKMGVNKQALIKWININLSESIDI